MLKSKKGFFIPILIFLVVAFTWASLLSIVSADGDNSVSSVENFPQFGWKCKDIYAILVVTLEDCETRMPLENATVTITVSDGVFIKGSLHEEWQTGSLSKETVLFPPKPRWWPYDGEWPNATLTVFFIKYKASIMGREPITVRIEISKLGYIRKEYDAVIKNRCRFKIYPRYCLNIERQCLERVPPPSVPEFPVERSFVLFFAAASYLVIKRKFQVK